MEVLDFGPQWTQSAGGPSAFESDYQRIKKHKASNSDSQPHSKVQE